MLLGKTCFRTFKFPAVNNTNLVNFWVENRTPYTYAALRILFVMAT